MICDNSKKGSEKTEQSLDSKPVRVMVLYKKAQLRLMPRLPLTWVHPVPCALMSESLKNRSSINRSDLSFSFASFIIPLRTVFPKCLSILQNLD